jgi:tryptophan halogenase
MKEIKTICVIGGGSAGSLSALTLKRLLPGRRVISVSAPDMPVIGVGESTTAYLPQFLHRQLGLDRRRFYEEVRPSWKLGIRFVWGPADVPHFNYPFSFELSERVGRLRKRSAYYVRELGGDPGIFSRLMDRDKSPVITDKGHYSLIDQPFGYHIDNPRFLAYLERQAAEAGVEAVKASIVDTVRDETGDIASLVFDDHQTLEADFFIDCSGFGSILLGKTIKEPFVSFSPPLRCNSAIVGDIPRTGLIRPYTSAETMDNGWCWRIELPERESVGYVFSSEFCSDEAATEELRRKNPKLTGDLRTIRFPSGRYQNFWRHNVAAIGNASGFVEPLESTALHVICEQLVSVCGALLDSDYRIEPKARDDANMRFRRTWDSIRDFLAVHYKFNTRSDTAFWQTCRAETDLGQAAEVVDLYQEVGPHAAMRSAVVPETLVQFEGYLALLIGQQVPTKSKSTFDDEDRQDWKALQTLYRTTAAKALPLRDALKVVARPDWRWP